MRRIALWFALLGLFVPRLASAQTSASGDYRRITQVPRVAADVWLKSQAELSGGKWDSQRYRFLIGFSTGHFGTYGIHAIAMSRLAFSLLNNSLAPGDQVTPFAWEHTIWNIGQSADLTNDPQTRATFVNGVPQTPEQNSHGGHDIYRTLYETLTRMVQTPDAAQHTIILLITNTNFSQGTDLMGANNAQLQAELKRLHYRVVQKTFPMRADGQALEVDVTALFPDHLTSLPGTDGEPRYPTFDRVTWQPPGDKPGASESLPNKTIAVATAPAPKPPVRAEAPVPPPATAAQSETTPAPTPGPSRGVYIVVALIALLLVVAIILTLRARRQRDLALAAKPTPKTPAKPPVAPIPGEIEVVIGSKTERLKSLTTGSAWTLLQDGANLALTADDAKDKASGVPIARLTFDAKKQLCVEADTSAQFIETRGSVPANLSPRKMTLAPGELARCRVAISGASNPPLFAVTYEKK